MRRTGKTTLLRRICNPPPRKLVVVDTLGEFAQRGFARGVIVEEFRQILLTQDSYQIAVYPEGEDQFAYVCEAAAARRDITLAIDELDAWCPTATHLPPRAVLNMALTGGHYNQTLIVITHRPASIHHSIWSQGVIWVFPMFDANDCATVVKHTRRPNLLEGVDPSGLQPTRTNYAGWIEAVELARVSPTDAMLIEFDLQTGILVEI